MLGTLSWFVFMWISYIGFLDRALFCSTSSYTWSRMMKCFYLIFFFQPCVKTVQRWTKIVVESCLAQCLATRRAWDHTLRFLIFIYVTFLEPEFYFDSFIEPPWVQKNIDEWSHFLICCLLKYILDNFRGKIFVFCRCLVHWFLRTCEINVIIFH